MMLKEQDQGLEELGSAVDRVGRMADVMNQELNAQNRMLGELEVEVENTNEQMNFVMGKLSKLLKTKGACVRRCVWCVRACVCVVCMCVFCVCVLMR